MFPEGEYYFPKDESCFWFTYEDFNFFLDGDHYEEWIEYNKTGDEEE
jgi:hypothetical protein